MAIKISGTTVIDNSRNITNTVISGVNNTLTVDGTNTVGFRAIPQNSQSANYTLVLADAGKHIFHPSADTTARTWTIPANSSVAFPIGTAITFINQNGAGVITITIATDTMRSAEDGTTVTRILAANGLATVTKITATEWIISGTGLTAGPPVLGAAYGGGFFAGQISTTMNSGVATHNLVIGPLSTAQATLQMKTTDTATGNIENPIDGPGCTAAMIAAGAADHPAANFCNNLTIGGFSDWYMPAYNELEVCYYNLKPTTTSNSSGNLNTNSVPARGFTNYTASNPPRTSVPAFISGGAEAFAAANYWSANEGQSFFGPGRELRFSDGRGSNFPAGENSGFLQGIFRSKNVAQLVRAVRRIPV